jgi:hypothetical protein
MWAEWKDCEEEPVPASLLASDGCWQLLVFIVEVSPCFLLSLLEGICPMCVSVYKFLLLYQLYWIRHSNDLILTKLNRQ